MQFTGTLVTNWRCYSNRHRNFFIVQAEFWDAPTEEYKKLFSFGIMVVVVTMVAFYSNDPSSNPA